MKFLTKIFIWLILPATVIFYGQYYIGTLLQEKAEIQARYDNATKLQAQDSASLEQKIHELKTEVVDAIQMCESGHHHVDAALTTFDPRQSDLATCSKIGTTAEKCFSHGPFQFKTDTVKHYYKKLYGEEITTLHAKTIAFDYEQSWALAKDVIFQEIGGVYNWRNCEKKTNARAKIEIIRTLMR